MAVECGATSRFWWRWKSAANNQAGSGAAGGLGFGLMAFLGARMEAGFDLIAKAADLERHWRWADLVITGEGCIDHSTFMGKGVGIIAVDCSEKGIPCLAFAGEIVAREKRTRIFAEAHALTDVTTMEKAKAEPAVWLEKLAERTALHF